MTESRVATEAYVEGHWCSSIGDRRTALKTAKVPILLVRHPYLGELFVRPDLYPLREVPFPEGTEA